MEGPDELEFGGLLDWTVFGTAGSGNIGASFGKGPGKLGLWGLTERTVFRGAGLPIMLVFLRTAAGPWRLGGVLPR